MISDDYRTKKAHHFQSSEKLEEELSLLGQGKLLLPFHRLFTSRLRRGYNKQNQK
jgi:hypothetical protein